VVLAFFEFGIIQNSKNAIKLESVSPYPHPATPVRVAKRGRGIGLRGCWCFLGVRWSLFWGCWSAGLLVFWGLLVFFLAVGLSRLLVSAGLAVCWAVAVCGLVHWLVDGLIFPSAAPCRR